LWIQKNKILYMKIERIRILNISISWLMSVIIVILIAI